MKAQEGDKRLGSRNQQNIDKINLIKREMVKVHDEIKAMGIYPTLRKILRGMPFWVHEALGTELRHQLIDEGKIPKPPRGCTKNAQLQAEHRIVHWASQEEIAERKLEINQEYLAQMKGTGENVPQKTLEEMTPQEASGWARKRHDAALANIRSINRWRFLAHPETLEGA